MSIYSSINYNILEIILKPYRSNGTTHNFYFNSIHPSIHIHMDHNFHFFTFFLFLLYVDAYLPQGASQ